MRRAAAVVVAALALAGQVGCAAGELKDAGADLADEIGTPPGYTREGSSWSSNGTSLQVRFSADEAHPNPTRLSDVIDEKYLGDDDLLDIPLPGEGTGNVSIMRYRGLYCGVGVAVATPRPGSDITIFVGCYERKEDIG